MTVKRAAIAMLVLVPVLLAALGVGDVVEFQSRAATLRRDWRADQAAGVTQAQLAPAYAALQSEQDRSVGLLPWSAFSLALFFDPFTSAEARAAAGEAQALAGARERARAALVRLQAAGGPNGPSLAADQAQLADAKTLPDSLRLATTWEAQADQLAAVQNQVSQASGGLTGGLPTDVVDGVSRLQSVISSATQAHLSTDPAPQALTDAQAYLKLTYPDLLARHASVAAEVQSAGDTVQHRIDTRSQADALVGELPGLLSQASTYGISGTYPGRAEQARTDVQTAESAGDDARMDTAATEVRQLVDSLSAAVARARQQAATTAQLGGCIAGAPAQLIVVHLATQRLVAYDNGCPFLTTLVTTGRPALPTDQGTFHIFAKYPTYHMISPWPPSSPFWYHDAWVADAMEFVSDGTFLHGASWEPLSAYGPGSENGPYASHGCVHIPPTPLAQLYGWAQIGATVQVGA